MKITSPKSLVRTFASILMILVAAGCAEKSPMEKAEEAAKDAGGAIKDAAKKTGHAIESTAEKTWDSIKDGAHEASKVATNVANETKIGAGKVMEKVKEVTK